MEKSEFLELFEAAEKAADAVKESDLTSSPEASRCTDALDRLKKAPPSLTHEVIFSTNIGKRLKALTKHTNPNIQSSAKSLIQIWRNIIFTSDRTDKTEKKTDSNGADRKPSHVARKASKVGTVKSVEKKTKPTSIDPSGNSVYSPMETGDPSRDKVREVLGKALAKVASEVEGESVVSCDPLKVAAALESGLFEKLGPFGGEKKLKYRSILFNMSDTKNPDLRRKVMLGEISAESITEMSTEELASEKIQKEYEEIRKRRLN